MDKLFASRLGFDGSAYSLKGKKAGDSKSRELGLLYKRIRRVLAWKEECDLEKFISWRIDFKIKPFFL